MMLELSSAMNYMKLQGHNFHFNFSSTSRDKVWMWHEMRYRSRANRYLINARPDWRAQAHLLHVSSNMHDLQAGFLPQQTFHAIRSISVKWCTQPAHRGSILQQHSWQMLCGLCQDQTHLRALNATKCQRSSESAWTLYFRMKICMKMPL